MQNLELQVWGASFYMLNKICYSKAERSTNSVKTRKWQIAAWVVFLVGLPAWVTVFVFEHNWIAAAVEAGGAPAMLVGLIVACCGHGKAPGWLNQLALVATLIGLGFSIYEFGSIISIRQILELFLSFGFLIGTYRLAKEDLNGYFGFVLGNISCAILMGIEGSQLFMLQQIVSLIFVIDAYRYARIKRVLLQKKRLQTAMVE